MYAPKDDVLDLALDEIFREVELPGRPGDWRADVRALITGRRAAMLRHPAATHGLANYVIGAALTQATGRLGEQDWDDLFGRTLDSLLTGLDGAR